MPISINNTTLTFNNGTTMTTAATGTVTSVATGNGLSGGTITTTGTLVVACPTFNTVGSYAFGGTNTNGSGTVTYTAGSNYSASSSSTGLKCANFSSSAGNAVQPDYSNQISGTWRWMAANYSSDGFAVGLICRVS